MPPILHMAESRPLDIESATVAIVVITHERLHLLRGCVENVLGRTSPRTTEIVVWNNASTDGTTAYLDSLTDPRLTVVHHPKNIGNNAYAEGVRLTTATHVVDLDDDVVEAPEHWDRTLLEAYLRLPEIGFLSADLEEDDNDVASYTRHRVRPHEYSKETMNGVALLDGPTGGGCAMTDRLLYDSVGGFLQKPNEVFFLEDAAYIESITRVGRRRAILADLRVHHTGGPYYASQSDAKIEYWTKYDRAVGRKNTVKRMLLRIPFVPRLNRALGLFGPVE